MASRLEIFFDNCFATSGRIAPTISLDKVSGGPHIMALFSAKPDPVATLQAQLDALKKEGVGLLKQHATALSEHTAATTVVNGLAGVDDDVLDRAEAKLAKAATKEQRRAFFVEQNISATKMKQDELDKAVDIRTRHATAAVYEALEAELVAEGRTLAASAARMAEISGRIIPIAFEASPLKAFTDAAVVQVPDVVTLLSRLIREHCAAVLRGEALADVRLPEAKFVAPVETKPERVPLFCLRSVKFVDPDSGLLVVIQKFQDGEFPPQHARAALEAKACTRLSDELRKQHHGTTPGHADVGLAFDLDALLNPRKDAPTTDPIMASVPPSQPDSPFELSDYGRKPATTMKVAR
jgi:hypothetical protein